LNKVANFESDATLIDRLKQGDQEAYRQLIESFKDRIFNTILSMIQHHHDAEDLTQEVFLKIHAGIGNFRGESGLSTWIYRMSVNAALDWQRKKRTRNAISYLKNVLHIGHDEISIPDFNHPGILLQEKEFAKSLFHSLHQLPSDQKTVFILMKIEALSQKDTAAIMGKSIKSIEGLLQRTKNNLLKKMNKTDNY
jgi:RNA polymerase sigma factor (sigma-70 family)